MLLFSVYGLAQPVHKRLIYSHSLKNGNPTAGETIVNDGGEFISDKGWQATTSSSQLTITLANPLPFEGTFVIDVTNFDPAHQYVEDYKLHIINLYSRIYTNNKDIFYTDGSWCNIRTGIGYSTEPGVTAGYKFLAAPRGVDTRQEVRCIEDAIWDPSQTHQFKITWTSSHIYCSMNNILHAQLPFSGQVEPFKYVLIGKDNLIWGYAAQPGVIYSNLRIYGVGDPEPDLLPPDLVSVSVVNDSTLLAQFDEQVDVVSATSVENYRIDSGLSVLHVDMAEANVARLSTSVHPTSGKYTLWVKDIYDKAETPNKLAQDSVSYYFIKSFIKNISKSNYQIKQKQVGDPVYSDRDYIFTHIPTGLLDAFWIETANDDKTASDETFLTFTVDGPVYVTIAYDSTIAQLPTWLQNWTPVSSVVRSTDTNYRCFEKFFPTGTIQLGANKGQNSSSMYLIAIRPAEDKTPPAPPQNVRLIYIAD